MSTETAAQQMLTDHRWNPLLPLGLAPYGHNAYLPADQMGSDPLFTADSIEARINPLWLVSQCCAYDEEASNAIDWLRGETSFGSVDLMVAFGAARDSGSRHGRTIREGDILTRHFDYVLFENRVAISMDVGSTVTWPKVFQVEKQFLPLDSRIYGISCRGGHHSWMWNGKVWNHPVLGPLDAMDRVLAKGRVAMTPIDTHPDLFSEKDTPVLLEPPACPKLYYDGEGHGFCPVCGRILSEYVTPGKELP